MKLEKFFTTGETAKFLSISRSTVTRKFDEKILSGKKNPITGEREISQKSIEMFAKKYSIELPFCSTKKTLVNLVTTDSGLKKLFQSFIDNFQDITYKEYGNGCDLIISMTIYPPDIVIVDNSLPDISETNLIKAIQRSITVKNTCIIGCYNTYEEAGEVKLLVDELLIKKDLNLSELKNIIMSKMKNADMGKTIHNNFDHNRMWRRSDVSFNTKIIESPNIESAYDYNSIEAKIINISLGGLYISKINYPHHLIRHGNANMFVTIDSYPLNNWEAFLKIVRFESNGEFGVGMKFMNINDNCEKKILTLINQDIK